MSFPPTAEQQAAIDAFATGENMVIDAGAGAGKTSTLRLMAESAPSRRGIYIAYNKAIATDAKTSFPSNVECATAHSYAFRAVGKRYARRLNGARVTSRQVVTFLGIPQQGFQVDPLALQPWQVAGIVMQTVNRFCSSADAEITTKHVPFVEGSEGAMDDLRTFIVPFARKAWADLNNVTGTLRFTHDHYLKMWAMTNPTLDCDFILLDEAQDANPVIAQVVENQTHAQQIMVGDRCQAIYGWRGAVDAMTRFNAVHHLTLSQSFRFGETIAVEANKWLDLLDAPLRLRGFEKVTSIVQAVENPDVILCRTNATVVATALQALGEGRLVAVVGGMNEIKRFAEAAADLMNGRRTAHPELIAFKHWHEVVDHSNEDDGRDLKVMVKLIEEHGVQTIIEVCDSSVSEARADIIISTAHKAKGREWDTVRIANDFKCPDPEKGESLSAPEMMLAYVAVTRAKKALDNAGLAWIDSFIAQAV